jgi:hypothetical protein
VTKTTCWIFPTLIRAVSNGVSFRANKDHVDFYGENEPIPPEPATTASVAPAVPVPNVPPLLANETPPSDGPNYIEPWELSSGAGDEERVVFLVGKPAEKRLLGR